MSKQSEIDKIRELLIEADADYVQQTGATPMPAEIKAEYLIRKGIGTKDRFEITSGHVDKGGYSLYEKYVSPIDYKENK